MIFSGSGNPPEIDQGSRVSLRLGFAAMLLLLGILVALGWFHLSELRQQIELVTHEHMVKLDLAASMHVAARERTVNLQKLVLLQDPFERDEQLLMFHRYAGEFAHHRGRLLGMALSLEERELLKEQGALTGQAVPIQEQIIELIRAGQNAEAMQMLVAQAIPAQDRVIEKLRSLYAWQQQQAERAVDTADRSYRNAQTRLLVLGLIILALSFAIAIGVQRVEYRSRSTLRREKERAQITLHSLSDAVIRADLAGCIEYMNPAAERLTGWEVGAAKGRQSAEVVRLLAEHSRESQMDVIARTLSSGEPVTDGGDGLLLSRSGREHSVEYTAAPIATSDGGIEGAVLVFRDVSQVRLLSRELTHQATHDGLTGLANRRELERALQQALLSARLGEPEAAFCYLDLDLFKIVNDTCGHLAGDELLKQLAMLLRQRIRQGDVLARLGGDEFGILLQGCSLDKALEIAEQVRRSVQDFHFVWQDRRFGLGASLGVIAVAADSGSLSDVLGAADLACSLAKEHGRNRVELFRAGDPGQPSGSGRIRWAQRLSEAIQQDGFELYAQLIVPLLADRNLPMHCELLLRLRGEGEQVILPASFLTAAERYHLMPQIDRWVIRTALALLRRYPLGCGDVNGSFTVNLSGQTLGDPGFDAYLIDELVKSAVAPSRLCFEITETAAVTNMTSAIHLIGDMRKRGCRFALDDFGSGLSSFSYLRNLPVDYLKIDGSFIRNIASDQVDHAMVNAICQIADVMDIHTIAEHIETDAAWQVAVELGVDYGQGYAIMRPLPLVQLLDR